MTHEFTNPDGDPYLPAVAASVEWLHVDINGNRKHSIVFPYDLSFVEHTSETPIPGVSARTSLLGEVLASWGHLWIPIPDAAELPKVLMVSQNHPNPFNPRTRIAFSLPQRGEVRITLYNVRGERITVLIDEIREAGPGFVDWHGLDARGAEVASGIYLYRVEAAGQEVIKKMALIR